MNKSPKKNCSLIFNIYNIYIDRQRERREEIVRERGRQSRETDRERRRETERGRERQRQR